MLKFNLSLLKHQMYQLWCTLLVSILQSLLFTLHFWLCNAHLVHWLTCELNGQLWGKDGVWAGIADYLKYPQHTVHSILDCCFVLTKSLDVEFWLCVSAVVVCETTTLLSWRKMQGYKWCVRVRKVYSLDHKRVQIVAMHTGINSNL